MGRMNVCEMKFSKVYPMLIWKAMKKGKTREDVLCVTEWLTGYSAEQIDHSIVDTELLYGDFFRNAPHWNERADHIRGASAAFGSIPLRTRRSSACGSWTSWWMSSPRERRWRRSFDENLRI